MSEIPTPTPVARPDAVPPRDHLAHRLLQLSSSCASYLLGAGISITLGFITPEPLSPLHLALQNPLLSASLVIALVIGLSLLTLFITRQLGSVWLFSRKTPLRVLQFVTRTALATVGGAILGIVLGLGNISSSAPILVLLRTHAPLGIFLLAVLLAAIILAPLIPADADPPNVMSLQHTSRQLNATAISITSTLLFLSLVSIIVIQPTWCPPALCPIYFDPHGVHDENLEVVFSAIQSSTFAIANDPERYSVNTAPQDMPALRIDKQFPPYRVVLKVDNRQRNGVYPIVIEQVALVVDQIDSVPNLLNVWSPGSPLDYHLEPYRVTVGHAPAGAKLSAEYLPIPGSHVQLQPGGADELDIQVVSTTTGVMRFHLQIVYRLANQSALHALTLPNRFQVTFSDASNWHLATIDGQGRLMRSP